MTRAQPARFLSAPWGRLFGFWFISVGLSFLLAIPIAWAEPRTALVIGNGAYPEAPLKNPVNDARDMAAKLRDLGFQTIERLDADRQSMRLALREFEQRLRQQRGVGLFYYAGHGVQLKGQNYLIPVGSDIRQEFEVPDEAVDAEAVLRAMESAGNELNIVILDACRNNPFVRGYGAGSRGLARMDGPAGTFIAYATAPGAISQDGGDGRNSPYTRGLLAAMSTPGLSLEQIFKQVLVAVERETSGAQIPWVASSLRGDFFFNPAPAASASPSPAATLDPRTPAGSAARPAADAATATNPSAAAPSANPTAPLEPTLVTVAGSGFAISRDPISLAAFRLFAEETRRIERNPSNSEARGAALVTWKEATDFAAWLAAKTGHPYRLPTEAEWERAFQSGDNAPDPASQDREWTCSEYRQSYSGQEQRCADRLPETVAIRGQSWRAGADPLSDDLEFRVVRLP